MITIRDLIDEHGSFGVWNNDTYVLLSYEDGQRALWLADEHLAGKVDDPDSASRYTINDVNDKTVIEPGEDIDDVVRTWKESVGWGDSE